MSSEHTGFGQTLSRASALPLLVFTAAASMVVPSAWSVLPSTPTPSASTPTVWKAAYSERFPGCVSMLLWPAAEKPAALVVLGVGGRVVRVSNDDARRLKALGQPVRAIGACRLPP